QGMDEPEKGIHWMHREEPTDDVLLASRSKLDNRLAAPASTQSRGSRRGPRGGLAGRSLTPCIPGRKWPPPAATPSTVAFLAGPQVSWERGSFGMRRSGVRPPSAPPIALGRSCPPELR